MKNAFLIPLSLFLSLAACKYAQSKSVAKPETTVAPAPEVVYACPMHPEITGKKGDKCSICKMDLVEKK